MGRLNIVISQHLSSRSVVNCGNVYLGVHVQNFIYHEFSYLEPLGTIKKRIKSELLLLYLICLKKNIIARSPG